MGKSKSQVVGHRWYWGQHLVLCHGPVDAITAIYFGEKNGWQGNVISNDTIHINEPTLFGDIDQYGGVVGDVDILLGHADQNLNDYLFKHCAKNVDGNRVISAFRHLTSLVFRSPQMGNSSYPPSVSVEVKRVNTGWDGNPIWYSDKSSISNEDGSTGMNPAHMIHELIECPEWGVGNRNIDDVAFKQVADTLYKERVGLNAHWTRQQAVEDFIKDICRYINGYVYTDEATGKITIKLARDNYNPDELPEINATQIRTCRNVRRRSQADIINTLTLTYTDPDTHDKAAITVMNSAMVNAVERTIGETVDFPMIKDASLAYSVAMRELKILSSRLLSAEIYCDTSVAKYQPGDVVNVVYPPAGLNHIMRVQKKRRGAMSTPEIKLDVIEDVFAPTSGEYTPPPLSDWVTPLNLPQPVLNQRIIEAPYWLLANTFNASELAAFSEESAMLIWLAAKPTSDTLGAELYFNNSNRWTYSHRTSFIPEAFTAEAINKQATTVALATSEATQALIQADLPMVCALNDELVVVMSIKNDIATLTRGVLDTHPQHHPTMSWLAPLSAEALDNEFIQGEQVKARALTVTPRGTLDETQAPITELEVQARAFKPLPVCNVRLNGAYDPQEVTLPLTIEWLHRNRFTQVGHPEQLTSWYNGAGTPEPNTQTHLLIEDQKGEVIVEEHPNLNTYTLTELPPETTSITITLKTIRADKQSFNYRLTPTTPQTF